MPELPEVETVVCGLRKILPGKTIMSLTSRAPASLVVIGNELKRKKLASVLVGREIHTVERRGKNILIGLSGEITLWVHLKMTGKFRYLSKTTAVDKHDLIVMDVAPAGNGCHLRFNDYRRFGRWRVYSNEKLWQQKGLCDLGPEPLEISADHFVHLCLRRPRMLKPALLDQTFLAGIGNIYADEALWATRLHPRRIITSISRKKLVELHGHIQRLLSKAIKHMGTSVDSYAGVNGQPGTFQNYLLAYGKDGSPCKRCGATIKREKIGARSAHFCPRCQHLN